MVANGRGDHLLGAWRPRNLIRNSSIHTSYGEPGYEIASRIHGCTSISPSLSVSELIASRIHGCTSISPSLLLTRSGGSTPAACAQRWNSTLQRRLQRCSCTCLETLFNPSSMILYTKCSARSALSACRLRSSVDNASSKKRLGCEPLSWRTQSWRNKKT